MTMRFPPRLNCSAPRLYGDPAPHSVSVTCTVLSSPKVPPQNISWFVHDKERSFIPLDPSLPDYSAASSSSSSSSSSQRALQRQREQQQLRLQHHNRLVASNHYYIPGGRFISLTVHKRIFQNLVLRSKPDYLQLRIKFLDHPTIHHPFSLALVLRQLEASGEGFFLAMAGVVE